MALTFNTTSKVIDSTASITDLVEFHATLRDWEDSETGAVNPVTHKWKAVSLGAGALFYACDLINGWRLRFPVAGDYSINGNLGAEIIPIPGVFVERKTSAAFATTSSGGSGPSAADIAAQVRQELSAELLRISEIAKLHGLVQGAPLVVTPTSRTAGDVAQTVNTAGATTTVTRQ